MSKLKMLSNFVTSKAGLQMLTLRKHSPSILFAAGVVGVVATVVLASKATLKLEQVLEDHEKNLNEIEHNFNLDTSDTDQDTYKRAQLLAKGRVAFDIAKLYAPAAIVGAASIAALTGSHVVLTQRNTALMAAYAAVDKAYKSYRKRVVQELGEDKDRQFQYGSQEREIVEETAEGPVVKTITEVDPNGYSMYAKFFDQHNKNWSRDFEYNQIFLRAQQNYLNDKLKWRGWLLLNEVYEALGFEPTRAGCIVGWRISDDGDNYVDFGMYDKTKEGARMFINGHESAIRLDFNVNGVIYESIPEGHK